MPGLSRVPKLRRGLIEAHSRLLAGLHPRVFGPGLGVFGWPIVTVAPGSTMRCGARLRLISDPVYSEPGIPHACVLRTLASGASLVIGDDVGMSGASVCAAVSVRIGDRVLLGAGAVIADTDFHPLDPAARRQMTEGTHIAPVVIGDDVFVGLNAVVLKGVTVGAGAVIGAGSVVVDDVPPGAVVAGAPARVVGQVRRET